MAETASSGAGSVERETMVNRTRRNRDRAAAPVLPDDLVLWEILYRLPPKEILRCRTACRSWRRLTCDEEFLLAHHHRQPSLPLVSFRKINSPRSDASVDALDLKQTPAVRRHVLGFNCYNFRPNLTIYDSCDGLLLLSPANGRFYICNPATRQWLALPALNGGNVAALYPHRPSGEYRILYWKNTTGSVVYYVLTVGSSERPRCIELPVASPSMKSDMTCWHIRAREHPPVLLHGCLHWYVKSKLVAFDTLVESFKWMESPIATNSAHLLHMDGRLGMGHIDADTMIGQVWVLQDYKMEIWSSKYQTALPLVDEMCTKKNTLYGKVVSANENMLVTLFSKASNWTRARSSLFHYCGQSKSLKKYEWQDDDPMVLGLCFKESLVRHVFFQRKDGDGHLTVPRFFRGL